MVHRIVVITRGNVSYHLLKGQKMTQSTSDSAFLFDVIQDELHGMCGTYVNDLLHAREEDYERIPNSTDARFK